LPGWQAAGGRAAGCDLFRLRERAHRKTVLRPSRVGHLGLQTLFSQFSAVRRRLRPGRLLSLLLSAADHKVVEQHSLTLRLLEAASVEIFDQRVRLA
jgi:hypothetical protein